MNPGREELDKRHQALRQRQDDLVAQLADMEPAIAARALRILADEMEALADAYASLVNAGPNEPVGG